MNTLASLSPVPLEQIHLAEHLTGEMGTNRAPAFITQQIAANNDLQAIKTWLAEFEHSPQTQRAYRKEAERLLLWSLIERQKPLSSLSRDDLRLYQHFLAYPEPSALWCGARKPRNHSHWRPFQGALSASSQAHAITVINALFSYLVEAGYLAGNPLGLMRRKLQQSASRQQASVIERFLEQDVWQTIVDYMSALPKNTPRAMTVYERVYFLFHLLYLTGARVSEVADAKMSSIQQHRAKWWWYVTGKGQKTQRIPLNAGLLNALMRYRQFYQLPPLPQPDEEGALFMSLNGQRGVSSNMIYRLVKHVFLACATQLEKTRPEIAHKLQRASTHWLRHTAITHQADAGIELRYIKRSARHENVQTTMLYQHAEDDLWHDAMAQHVMPPPSQ